METIDKVPEGWHRTDFFIEKNVKPFLTIALPHGLENTAVNQEIYGKVVREENPE